MAEAMATAYNRNYLRVRGEYVWCVVVCAGMWELPPRARRIRDTGMGGGTGFGTTSACAENTLNELGLL